MIPRGIVLLSSVSLLVAVGLRGISVGSDGNGVLLESGNMQLSITVALDSSV